MDFLMERLWKGPALEVALGDKEGIGDSMDSMILEGWDSPGILQPSKQTSLLSMMSLNIPAP